ncbi:hypothetical protein GCM10009434_31940 [Brevundimonas olei]
MLCWDKKTLPTFLERSGSQSGFLGPKDGERRSNDDGRARNAAVEKGSANGSVYGYANGSAGAGFSRRASH